MDYPINDDFKKLKMMTFPIVEGFAPAAEKVLGVFVNVNHSDKNVSVEKFSINSDGTSLPCLLYSPRGKNGKLPLVVYYHGGGFIYKAAPYHYRLLKEYCHGANCMVLCVDYRNTPKYNFNQIFPDCYSTLEWAVKNADRIGADLNKFAVAGDSAGGCLAASTVLKARDEGLVNLCGMLLVYPVLDSSVSTESMKKFVDTPVWNSILNRKMWQLYLPEKADGQNAQYVSPASASDLSHMPPTYIQTAEFDCLRDEGVAFADALKSAGNSVALDETKGTVHGFDMASHSPITACAVNNRISFLNQIFE